MKESQCTLQSPCSWCPGHQYFNYLETMNHCFPVVLVIVYWHPLLFAFWILDRAFGPVIGVV